MDTLKNKMKEMETEQQQFSDIAALQTKEEGRRRQVELNKEKTEKAVKEKQKHLQQVQEKYSKIQVINKN
jgi:hypothetical protein